MKKKNFLFPRQVEDDIFKKLPSFQNPLFKNKCKLEQILIKEPDSIENGIIQLSKILKEITCEISSFLPNFSHFAINFLPNLFHIKLVADSSCSFILSKYSIIDTDYSSRNHSFYSIPLSSKLINQQIKDSTKIKNVSKAIKPSKKSKGHRNNSNTKKLVIKLGSIIYFQGYDPLRPNAKAIFQKVGKTILHTKKISNGKWKETNLTFHTCKYDSK